MENILEEHIRKIYKNHKENIYYLFLLDDSNRKINNDVDVCSLKKVLSDNVRQIVAKPVVFLSKA